MTPKPLTRAGTLLCPAIRQNINVQIRSLTCIAAFEGA